MLQVEVRNVGYDGQPTQMFADESFFCLDHPRKPLISASLNRAAPISNHRVTASPRHRVNLNQQPTGFDHTRCQGVTNKQTSRLTKGKVFESASVLGIDLKYLLGRDGSLGDRV